MLICVCANGCCNLIQGKWACIQNTNRAPTPTPGGGHKDYAGSNARMCVPNPLGACTDLATCEKACSGYTPTRAPTPPPSPRPPTPPPPKAQIKWSITWGTAGSHSGTSTVALGTSLTVWSGKGSGYTATFKCARSKSGQLSGQYTDTNGTHEEGKPVASGCSKFSLESFDSLVHNFQCCL